MLEVDFAWLAGGFPSGWPVTTSGTFPQEARHVEHMPPTASTWVTTPPLMQEIKLTPQHWALQQRHPHCNPHQLVLDGRRHVDRP